MGGSCTVNCVSVLIEQLLVQLLVLYSKQCHITTEAHDQTMASKITSVVGVKKGGRGRGGWGLVKGKVGSKEELTHRTPAC